MATRAPSIAPLVSVASIAIAMTFAGRARAQSAGVDATKSATDASDAGHAPAISTEAPPKPWEVAPATRRAGFITGVFAGFGIASVAGFPNDLKKIGRARYYTVTGVIPGGSGMLWIGGALTDYFNFGLGLQASQLISSGNTINNVAFTFHVEAFPLFPLGGAWRDAGVLLDAGTGSVIVHSKDDSTHALVDGGATSEIGGGVFYEGLQLGKFGLGPFLLGNYYWSDSARRPGVFAGLRGTLYAARPKKKP